MFQFKGTIIRPNMKTHSWHIRRAHTLWDPILFTIELTLKFMYKLFIVLVPSIHNICKDQMY